MFSKLCCLVLALTYSLLSYLSRRHLVCFFAICGEQAFSLCDSVAVSGHNSALYMRADRIIDSYSRIFTSKLIFFIFPKTVAAFPFRKFATSVEGNVAAKTANIADQFKDN